MTNPDQPASETREAAQSKFGGTRWCEDCNSMHLPNKSCQNESASVPNLRMSGNNAKIIIEGAHRMLRQKYRDLALWCLVHDLTGHGSGYSQEICVSAGLDPHQNAGLKNLKPLPQPPAGKGRHDPIKVDSPKG